MHWFADDDGGWWVAFGDERQSCQDRASAFQQAKELARRNMPSRLVPSAPSGRPVALDTAGGARVARAPVSSGGAAPDWARLAGPAALGRSLLVSPGDEIPAPWADCARLDVTPELLCEPGVLAAVRRAYLARTPVVYVVDPACTAPAPGVSTAEVWGTAVDFDFVEEATWSLMTWNAVDARSGATPWSWSELAISLGAEDARDADVRLPDGREAWCDGGALRLWSRADLDDGTVVVPRESLGWGRLEAGADGDRTADLAEDQLDAVRDPEMRARIIAPAGSGKTRVLAERARHLLASSVPSESLTLVAFNKRAQLEIAQRTGDLPGLQVRTLNALALSILNGTNGFTPRGARVDTIDEPAVRDLLGSLVKFPRRANTDPAAPWLDALSRIRLGLRSPRSVEAEFDGDVDGLTELYPRYRAELAHRGLVDFDEQIHRALEVLLGEPDVRQQAERRCAVLLVDEFQDLTPAHMLLLRLLAGPTLGIFGVGDDDQTIYGYSGATPRWLVDFDAFVPEATHHALSVNYRCPVPVVEAASNLLSRNRVRVDKSTRAGPRNVSSPDALAVRHDANPTAATTEIVKDLLARGARADEIAVLTRVNSLLAPVQASLAGEGIAVSVRDGLGFLGRTGVAAALAWLRVATAPDALRSSDLAQAARRPSRGISPRVIEWIGEQSDVAGIERLAGRISDNRSAEKVLAFASDVRGIGEVARTADTASLLEFTRTKVGLEQSMQTLDEAHVGRNSQAHSDDLRALIALGRLHPDAATFTQWLTEVLRTSNAEDGVTLATVHKVKGLEWPHVVVHDASAGLFPHRLSTDVEEERRIFHVAITRARATLHVVADRSDPSIFLDELSSMGPATGEEPLEPLEPSGGRPAEVEAVPGLTFGWGGYVCRVLEVDGHQVSVSIGPSQISLPLGSSVVIAGQQRRLCAPRASSRPTRGIVASDASPEVLDALKTWRRGRAQKDKVPAYVVASDKTLAQVAASMPSSEAELLDVHGIGATKVELYGDELLAVLDALR